MGHKRCRILVVDDEMAMREVLRARFAGWGFDVQTADNVTQAGQLISRFVPHVVVSDLVLPDGTGLDLLRDYHREDRRFIIVTAYGTVDTAVAAMKGGATEFLTKPLDYVALRALLEAHEEQLGEAEQNAVASPHGLVGESQAIQLVHRQIEAVAPAVTSVLVIGESGTGKELVARAIHSASSRGDAPFVAVNAAAIPASLVEGELLGHERGAFTGAETSRPGFFEQAHGGTLFLDEVTEMPIALQPKLLRVLEDGRVRRLGSAREIDCDVRVVAATNRAPHEAVEAGLLREDLYHRICVFRIALPPLRERREDIVLLVKHLLQQLAERDKRTAPPLTNAALTKLTEHQFPGNVRELKNVLESAWVLSGGGTIEAEHVVLHDGRSQSQLVTSGITMPADVTVADAERILIVETLKRVGNNKAEAARRLGVDVKTIRNKLKTFSRNA